MTRRIRPTVVNDNLHQTTARRIRGAHRWCYGPVHVLWCCPAGSSTMATGEWEATVRRSEQHHKNTFGWYQRVQLVSVFCSRCLSPIACLAPYSSPHRSRTVHESGSAHCLSEETTDYVYVEKNEYSLQLWSNRSRSSSRSLGMQHGLDTRCQRMMHHFSLNQYRIRRPHQ
jgi:hypothetical protein